MRLFYNFSIRAYRLAIGIASLFDTKAKKWIAGREDIFTKLETAIDRTKPLAWFHCASLGEFEQGRPVIEAFKKAYPSYKILVTFFSPSGYEIRKSYNGADHVFYLPIDTRANAKRFLSIVQPKIAVFVKYEFWYNYLELLHKQSIPHFLISAAFRPDQPFFKSYGGWMRKALKNYTHIFVQDEASRDLLESIGVTHVSVNGDTRFDRVSEIVAQAKTLPIAEAFANGAFVIIAGSTWEEDEQLLVQLMREHKEIKIIIAPHEIPATHINTLHSSLAPFTKVIRYSQADEETAASAQVLIINNIGMLSSLYRYGKIAYIGGGFGKGIHNTLEAAAYGMPVIFGPNYEKFVEAKALVKEGGAFSISNFTELDKIVTMLSTDSKKLEHSCAVSYDYVQQNKGATKIIIDRLAVVIAISRN